MACLGGESNRMTHAQNQEATNAASASQVHFGHMRSAEGANGGVCTSRAATTSWFLWAFNQHSRSVLSASDARKRHSFHVSGPLPCKEESKKREKRCVGTGHERNNTMLSLTSDACLGFLCTQRWWDNKEGRREALQHCLRPL
jgi:hypothetical protein